MDRTLLENGNNVENILMDRPLLQNSILSILMKWPDTQTICK